jgi:hypothetical protein
LELASPKVDEREVTLAIDQGVLVAAAARYGDSDAALEWQ